MNDFDQFERSLAAALRSDADQSLAQFEPATVARAAMARPQPRAVRLPWKVMVRPRSNRWAVAAAAVVGVLLVGGAFLLIQRGQPSIGGPSPTPSAVPSRPAAVAPSAEPTATPSPTPTPIVWTQASLDEDWPAPVRAEPIGGAIALPQAADADRVVEAHPDPEGDAGSADYPWVDILDVRGGSRKFIGLASNHPPLVHPSEQWIAYGVVVDDDRDGIADRRFGIDNIPGTAPGASQHRAWITDLHTGRTLAAVGPGYGFVGDTYFDTFYPSESRTESGLSLGFGGDLAGGGRLPGLVAPFYAWASVIDDGRVVATDYAPDSGWLDPSPTSQVERSPSPSPQGGRTPQVENDPDVPGGRLWSVTVVNDSSEPATLFIAEEDENGIGRLVGSVTPGVVSPGNTDEVTFHLPARSVTGWWIFVNPGPDGGALLSWDEVPLGGEIHITEFGQVMWG